MSFCENKLHSITALIFPVLLIISFLTACGGEVKKESKERNSKAEHMLYGVWFNEDDNSVAFRAADDTIYYPDSTSLPVSFRIIGDTLYLDGSSVVAYPIVRQTEHLFVFKNTLGDNVRLVKTNDDDLSKLFEKNHAVAVLNQNKLIKKDTVITHKDVRYHSYVQVNPTTYKVVRPVVNNEGVTVENVYYDNIVNICIYRLSNKIYSKDFRKTFFKDYVPDGFYESSILSDIVYVDCDELGFHYEAALYIPDSMTSFLVEMTISFDGRLQIAVDDENLNN